MSAATLVTAQHGTFGRNLANILTLLRLALALPVAALVLAGSPGDLVLAELLFGIAALTDLADGRVARRRGQVSNLGAFLDPVADKCVLDMCVVALLLVRAFPAALALLLIGRDLAVTALRLTNQKQPARLAPGRPAKIKTCALYAGIGGLILGRMSGGPVLVGAWLLVAVGAALSLLSALQYLRHARSALIARQSARSC